MPVHQVRRHGNKIETQRGLRNRGAYFIGGAVVLETEQSVGELITQVRLDIRELMTEIKSLKDMGARIEDIRERIIKAEDSVKHAHQRLNAHDKIIFWAGTTIIGGLIIGALTLLFKTGG